ncbi:hypothetical protein C8A03DRAFT_18032 [Achaetomium macrosporum]|uniref:Aflatoxin biosynthesis ketoreductase nor-1 n=1 Tax=Achaetomium macrosporum TaxID=79813 RepID=A0AAN7C4P9_9PEZI|nr:hypothetical protein C8A03DRAFT_18032 [Achaetomium macrosporum]
MNVITTNSQAHANGGVPSTPHGGYKITYLITGASRGIGKGLVAAYLLRPSHTVIACVRNVATQSTALQSLPKHDSSTLIVVKLDCASETDAATAVSQLRVEHNVTHIDVVIANAAIADNFGPASTMPLEHLHRHMMVNTYSVLLLFQATRTLLQAAQPALRHGQAKFVLIGAPLSTITGMEEYARAPMFNYCISKLAANYLVRKLHFENKWLVAFIVDPGHVQTDMGDQGARLMGRKEAPTTLRESVEGICARIDEATKEASSGQFLLHEDGSKLPW